MGQSVKSHLATALLWLLTSGLLLLSVAQGWWYRFWVFELAGTAYLWFAALTGLLLLGLLVIPAGRRKRRVQIGLAIALLFYAESILPWYLLRPRVRGTIPVTVITYNVNYQLWDTAAVTNLVRENPADILGLVEPYKEQAAELHQQVNEQYPYYYRATGGNLSLFSRYPITSARTDSLKSPHQSLFATLNIQGKAVQLVLVRPPAPLTRSLFNRRNQVLRTLADYVKRQSSPVIVMGDFNTTAWSVYLREFGQRSGLRNGASGHGLHPTWYYATTPITGSWHRLFQWIKIPIDHIFVSASIQVETIRTSAPGVSDHRPLIAKVRV